MHITKSEALNKLASENNILATLFEHGTLSIEVYSPDKKDLQKPHDQDEVYIIISGSGTFYNDGERVQFSEGDFLFVPAGIEHRFENFTDDFSTWVIFYGPKGGETTASL